jgi:site-specific recombinase XerD
MNQALARFERFIKRRFSQTSTLKHYISDLNIFIDTVGNKAPESVTAEDIDTFVDNQIAAGLSPATINRRLASLHTFFEYLASEKPERDWPNPVIRRRHKLKTGSYLPRDVPDDAAARLFAVITDERDRAMFGLMVGYGRPPTARTIQRRLASYGQQAGVQVSPHRLRHTVATRLINQGMPIHSLRKLLGHQYLNTAQVYARIYDETLYEQFKTAMSRLEAIAVDDWPGVDVSEPAVAENWTARPI